jgi:hypothetical protein
MRSQSWQKTSDAIISLLRGRTQPCPLFVLKREISADLVDDSDLQDIISEMVTEGKIRYTSGGLEAAVPSLEDAVSSLPTGTKEIVTEYLGGTSPAAISEIMKMSEDAILATLDSFFDNRSLLEEDGYRADFERYRFSRSQFKQIYGESDRTYIYLTRVYKKGESKPSEMQDDETRGDRFRAHVREVLSAKDVDAHVNRGDQDIRSTITLALRERTSKQFTYQGAYDAFLEHIDKKGLTPDRSTNVNLKRFISTLESMECILPLPDGRLRFFDTDPKDTAELIRSLDLSRYRNVYLTSRKIFRDNADVMEAYDLASESELYSFLKRNKDKLPKRKIKFIRPASILFGNADPATQMRRLLRESSPIHPEELADRYEDRYGLSAATVRSTLLPKFEEYLIGGAYDINPPKLTDKRLDRMRDSMTRPWYELWEVQAIFSKVIGTEYEKFLNPFNLKRLGYRQATNYVYSSKYPSAEKCFEDTLCKDEVFEVNPKLRSDVQSVGSMLRKKEQSLEIIRFSGSSYIKASRLLEIGISKEQLTSYSESVYDFVKEGEYFTLKSILDDGFDHGLRDLGFEDTFYHSLIQYDDRIKRSKVSGMQYFRKDSDASFPDFLEFVVSKEVCIDLLDLLDLFRKRYGVELTPIQIKNAVKGTDMYYSDVTEKVYIDYAEYYERV